MPMSACRRVGEWANGRAGEAARLYPPNADSDMLPPVWE